MGFKIMSFSQSIFRYCDFRDFITDYFQYRKKEEGLTLDQFAHDTEMTRANIWRLMEGGSPLKDHSKLFKLSQYMGLSQEERRYFQTLAQFNQSDSAVEALDSLESLMDQLPREHIDSFVGQFGIYPWWLTLAVFELVQMESFSGSLQNIAKRFQFPVSTNNLKKALEILETNGYLVRQSKMNYEAQEEQLHFHMAQGVTERERAFARKAVFALQCKQLEISHNAADSFDPESCYMITHTLAIDEAKVEELESLILEFRDRIQAFMKENPSSQANRIYQLNTSLITLFK